MMRGGGTFQKSPRNPRETLPENHIDTAKTRHRLGWLYVYQGRYREAKRLLEEPCLSAQGHEGLEPFTEKCPFVTLAWLYSSEGRYDDGLRIYEYVLSLARKAKETDNTGVNYVYNGLGLFCTSILAVAAKRN